MNDSTRAHAHAPYSHRHGQFRCLCGAAAPTGIGPWGADGTRGCAACSAPTRETGDLPLCPWHRLISRAESGEVGGR